MEIEDLDPQLKAIIENLNHKNKVFNTMFSCYGHYKGEKENYSSFPYIIIKFNKRGYFTYFMNTIGRKLLRKYPYLELNIAELYTDAIRLSSKTLSKRESFWKDIPKEVLKAKEEMENIKGLSSLKIIEGKEDVKQAVRDYIQSRVAELGEVPPESYDKTPGSRARHGARWAAYLASKAAKKGK